MRRILPLLLVAACGPKPTASPIPTLPGDGDRNVAKPTVPKGATNDPWANRTDLIAAPAPKPPSAIELPNIEEYKLANGLQVYAIKTDRLPVVSMQLAVRAGRMHEPRARLGVSEYTADMLVKGTKRRDALALAKAIDFVGGTIAADATFEATLVSCSVLSRNTATCLELLPEMLTQPTFPDAELTKIREQLLGNMRQRLDDAATLASAHVQNLLWGNDHVRGWIDSEQSIGAIRRDDIVAWHKAWFVPNNAILVVAGDIDLKKLKLDLERAFGVWKKGTVPPAPQYKEPGLSGSRIRLVDKPGQTQTHIRIAQFGIKHDDPKFFDTLVWNYVLGGGVFNSRLTKVVRVEGGKTYGASSSFDRNLDKGSFVVQTFTRNSEAVATTKLLLGEIAKLDKDGPTKEEVATAVANITGGYGLRFQSASDLGGAVIGAELHNFGREYLTNFPLQVGKVDADSAKAAAADILDPKSYVLVMVGDAKDLEPQLQKAGWKYQKVAFNEPISPPPPVPETPIDPKQAAVAKQLVDEALVAKGGKAKLAAIKAFKVVQSGTTTIGGQNVPIEIERLSVFPDRMRIDATLAQRVKVVYAIDGKKGWQIAPDQKTGQAIISDITPDLTIEFERWREPDFILLRAADAKAKITTMPDENIDGKPHSVVKLRAPAPFDVDINLYIDKKTKLISRMAYQEAGQTEADEFGDYKDVKGIKVAHKRDSSGPGKTTHLVIKSIEWDPKVDPKLWDKPAAP